MLKKKILPIGAAALVLIGMTACGQKTDKKKAAATDINKKPAIVQNKNQKSAPKAEIKKAAPKAGVKTPAPKTENKKNN